MSKSAFEGFGAADYAMLAWQFIRNFHTLLGNHFFHTLRSDTPLEQFSVKQFQFVASELSFVFVLLLHKVANPLHIERRALDSLRVVETNNKTNGVRSPMTSASAGLSLENHRPLVYRAEAP